MIKVLQFPWLVPLLGSVLYLATTAALLLKPGQFPPISSPISTSQTFQELNNSWDYKSLEVDQLIQELKKERETLTVREQQLNELAARLQAEKNEINQVTQAVHQLQKEFDAAILRIQEQEVANLKKLAKVYGNMNADGAALILKEMTNDQLVKILVFMKEKETADILESIAKISPEQAKRAADLSDRIRLSAAMDKPLKPAGP